MARFRSLVVTEKGKEMMAQALESNTALTFSSLKIGSGSYSGSENLENAVELKEFKKSFPIHSIQRFSKSNIKVKSTVSNEDVMVGYHLTEYGLYVNSGKLETLFAISTAIHADFFPSFSESPMEILTELYVHISNAENIEFTYTVPEGVFASISDLESKVDVVGGDISNTILHEIDSNEEEYPILQNGEKVSVIVGKIKRVFEKLKGNVESLLRANRNKELILPATAWSSSAPYTQSINMAGVTSADVPVGCPKIPIGASAEYKKSTTYIDGFTTEDGRIAFYCNRKRPTVDVTVIIKGV